MPVGQDLAAYVSLWDVGGSGDFQTFAEAIGVMFAEVEAYAEASSTQVGWQPLWDVDLAPASALPWQCMLAGERAPAGATAAQLRSLIKAAPNQDRGTPTSIVAAVQQCLTGSQIVGFRERSRSDGTYDENAVAVFTYQSQTPDQNQVLAALRRTVPFDINIYYQCLAGPTWAGLETGTGGTLTWTELEATYGPAWTNVENALPGFVIYVG